MTHAQADLILGPDDDCDAGLADLERVAEMVRRLQSLRPFGHEFEEPTFQVVLEPTGCRLDKIGSEKQHLRLTTRDGLACLWWNSAGEHYEHLNCLIAHQRAHRHQSLADGGAVPEQPTLRFNARLQLNQFAGRTRLQAVINEMVVNDDHDHLNGIEEHHS